jgi:hypothetical protein
MAEPTQGVCGGNSLKRSGDSWDEGFPRACSDPSEDGLGLGPGVFYWVQVRGIRGEKFKAGTGRANERGDLGILMNSEVVPD